MYSTLRIVVQQVVTVAGVKTEAIVKVPVIPRFAGNELVYFEEGGSSGKRHRPWQVLGFATPDQDPLPVAKLFHERFMAWQDKRQARGLREKLADEASTLRRTAPGIWCQPEETDEDMLLPKGHGLNPRREQEFVPDVTQGADWINRALGDGTWRAGWDLARPLPIKGIASPLKKRGWDIRTPGGSRVFNVIAALAMTRYSQRYLMNRWGLATSRKDICDILQACERDAGQTGLRQNWEAVLLDEAAVRLVQHMKTDQDFMSWLAYTGSRALVYTAPWGKEEGMTQELCAILHKCVMAYIRAIYKLRQEVFNPPAEEEEQALRQTMMEQYLAKVAEKIVLGEPVKASR